jgi:hypothetical protein
MTSRCYKSAIHKTSFRAQRRITDSVTRAASGFDGGSIPASSLRSANQFHSRVAWILRSGAGLQKAISDGSTQTRVLGRGRDGAARRHSSCAVDSLLSRVGHTAGTRRIPASAGYQSLFCNPEYSQRGRCGIVASRYVSGRDKAPGSFLSGARTLAGDGVARAGCVVARRLSSRVADGVARGARSLRPVWLRLLENVRHHARQVPVAVGGAA